MSRSSKRTGTSAGWQLVPEFHVSQESEVGPGPRPGQRRSAVVGSMENHRGSHDMTCLRGPAPAGSTREVIPFFEAQPLLSSKQPEFETFAPSLTRWNEANTGDWLRSCSSRALTMNGGGEHIDESITAERPESSETICRDITQGGAVKRWSDLHGDMQSQAEMSWPPTKWSRGHKCRSLSDAAVGDLREAVPSTRGPGRT